MITKQQKFAAEEAAKLIKDNFKNFRQFLDVYWKIKQEENKNVFKEKK